MDGSGQGSKATSPSAQPPAAGSKSPQRQQTAPPPLQQSQQQQQHYSHHHAPHTLSNLVLSEASTTTSVASAGGSGSLSAEQSNLDKQDLNLPSPIAEDSDESGSLSDEHLPGLSAASGEGTAPPPPSAPALAAGGMEAPPLPVNVGTRARATSQHQLTLVRQANIAAALLRRGSSAAMIPDSGHLSSAPPSRRGSSHLLPSSGLPTTCSGGLPPTEPLSNPRRGSATGSFGLPVPPEWLRAQKQTGAVDKRTSSFSMPSGLANSLLPEAGEGVSQWVPPTARTPTGGGDKRLLQPGTTTKATAPSCGHMDTSPTSNQRSSQISHFGQQNGMNGTNVSPSRYSFEDRESPPMQEDLNRQLLRRSTSGGKPPFHSHISESSRPPPSALIQEPERETFEGSTCFKVMRFFNLSGRDGS